MSEVQWRRRWKPTLDVQPWLHASGVKGVKEGKVILFKCLFTEDTYQILVTNMERVWHEDLEGREILKRSKKLNPNVEAPLDKLLDHLKDHTQSGKADLLFKKQDDDDDSVGLTLRTTLAGLPFVWRYNCLLDERECLSQQFSMPLLSMVEELLRRQKELVKLLHSKDTELEDLKAQGVKTSRKHLETGRFVDTAFNNAMSTSKGFEQSVRNIGTGAFNEAGQELYREMMTKTAWIKRDPDEDADMDEAVAEGAGVGESWSQRVPPSITSQASPSKTQKSPIKSPKKSPAKPSGSAENTPTKDAELMRREALQKRLLDEQEKKEVQKKKKKKLKL